MDVDGGVLRAPLDRNIRLIFLDQLLLRLLLLVSGIRPQRNHPRGNCCCCCFGGREGGGSR